MDSTAKDREHLLALKVMRLTKPGLFTEHRVGVDTYDLRGALQHTLDSELWAKEPTLQFPIGDLLTLPQSFGNIFLGETFTSCISVHNESNQVATDVTIKADLQTSSQRVSLSGNVTDVTPELHPNHSIDDIISHEVKELGTHILVCAVNYSTLSGEKLYFRKFFKFQVLKPIDVKTKFYGGEDDDVYLEAQIQNITSSLLCMEKVSLEPSPLYAVEDLNVAIFNNDVEETQYKTCEATPYMCPMDTRQFLYCLRPRKGGVADSKAFRGVTLVGKLDILWKSNMGECGRLQTSSLQRIATPHGDIRLEVNQFPDVAEREKLIDISCCIANCVERPMELSMTLENQIDSGMFWYGITCKQLGQLEPNSSLNLELQLVFTQTGLQSVSGIRITDTFLKRTYDYDDVAQILIVTPGR